jgi:8-oxo-dGTP diphosphatase
MPLVWYQQQGSSKQPNQETDMTDTETFETIRYTADVVVTTTDGYVLLIERGWDPHKGMWALPGGHVDPGETSREAAVRELGEEAGVHTWGWELEQVGVFDRPDRDPRGRYVSVAYQLTVLPGTIVEAGTDAVRAEWWPLSDLPALAFDHAEIINEAANRL